MRRSGSAVEGHGEPKPRSPRIGAARYVGVRESYDFQSLEPLALMNHDGRRLLTTFLFSLATFGSAATQAVLHEQHAYLGDSANPRTDFSGFVRVADAERFIGVFSADDSIGWGRSPNQPDLWREINGMSLIYADEDASTSQSFSVVVQNEDSMNPGRPLMGGFGFFVQSPGGGSRPISSR